MLPLWQRPRMDRQIPTIYISRPTPTQAAAAMRHKKWFRPPLKPAVVAVPIESVETWEPIAVKMIEVQVKVKVADHLADSVRRRNRLMQRAGHLRAELCAIEAELDVPNRPTIKEIQRVVCSRFEIRSADLLGSSRNANIVLLRHLSFYLCAKLTGQSMSEIARRHGGRDHTTGIHAVRRIESQTIIDVELRNKINSFLTMYEAAP